MPQEKTLDGRRVVVVGASSGIGKSIATRAVALGASVVFVGRREQLLDEAVRAAGAGHAVLADITVPEQCTALVDDAVKHLGGIDLVIVAASVSELRLLRDCDGDYWDRIFRTNVFGPSMVVAAALPHLSADAIVALLSSDSVELPMPGISPYAASKAALNHLIESWRLEERQVRFARVTVGNTAGTDFARDFDQAVAGELLPGWVSLGRVAAQMMDPVELGTTIADTLAIALSRPGVDPHHYRFMPPGGPLTDASALLASLDEAVART